MKYRSCDTKQCEKCGDECYRDEADVGVGIIYGPWGCPSCGWSESPEYDRSNGQSPANIKESGTERITDQYGVSHHKERLAEQLAKLEFIVSTMNVIGEL